MFAALSGTRARKKLLTALLAALVCTMIVSYYRYQEYGRSYLYLTMRVQSDNDLVMAQLFYDIGRGFNQRHSLIVPVEADSSVQKISFRLPRNKIRALRLDPINGPGVIELQTLDFISYHGQLLGSLDLGRLKVLKDIDSIRPNEHGVVITVTGKANPDASLLLEDASSIGRQAAQGDLPILLGFATKLFVMLALGFSIPLLIVNSGEGEEKLPV